MNIFVTDTCPVESAVALDDKRVVKMALESAQMLSTALHLIEGTPVPPPYRINHKNHPCTIWARTTKENYRWLLEHFVALCDEYTLRYGKVHASSLHLDTFKAALDFVQDGPLTPFANCTIFKEETDTVKAYREFMIHKWKNLDSRKPTWKNRQSPLWFT